MGIVVTVIALIVEYNYYRYKATKISHTGTAEGFQFPLKINKIKSSGNKVGDSSINRKFFGRKVMISGRM